LEWKRNVCESEEGGGREVARRRRKIKRRRMEGKPFDARAQTVKEEINRGERERETAENMKMLTCFFFAFLLDPTHRVTVCRFTERARARGSEPWTEAASVGLYVGEDEKV
jgi:hypothetical protein